MNGKQIKTVVMATLLFLSVFTGAFAGSVSADHGDNGTTEVSTAQEFKDAMENASDGTVHIVLMDNIDMSNVSGYSPPDNVSGTIDGNGYEIQNLNVSVSSHAGLVASASDLTVKNVVFDSPVVSSSNGKAGVVVGFVNNSGSVSISDVEVINGDVDGYDYSGGLIGDTQNADSVQVDAVSVDSDVDLSVSGTPTVGGVVGSANNTEITNAQVDIYSETGGGAMVGQVFSNTTISQSSAVGNITASGDKQAGGLVAAADNTDSSTPGLNISNSYADVDISASGGNSFIGGIAGSIMEANIEYSYAVGSVDASSTTGDAGGAVASVTSVTANQLFYDNTSSGTGMTSSAVGTGQTTEFMTGDDAVSNMGFSSDIWTTTDNYPSLSSENYDGYVYDESQTEMSGANVTLYDSNGSEIANLTTDSNGFWSYDGSADVQSIEVSADGYYTATIDDPSTVVTYSTTLTEGSDGAGLAVIASYNDSGNAITQGTVSITGPSSAEAELDENGVASFSNLDAGNYTVTLSSEKIQEDVTAEVSVEAGQSETVSISGKAWNTITGSITDTNGNPIAGVTAELQKTENNSTTIVDSQISDENGEVEFERVADGNYTLIWSVYDTTYEQEVSVQDPGDNTLTIAGSNDFKTGTLEMTIKQDESVFGGDPIENATVYVFAKDDTLVATLNTNADGVASTELATADGYWFQPVKDGYTTYHSKTDLDDGVTVQVYENQTTQYTAPMGPSLEPAPTLVVNTTVDGEPVEANVTVTEQYIGNEVLNGTASNGTVEYLNPYSGGYYVIDAEYTENGTTYTADTTYRVAENGTNTVELALQSESAGGGGFFGDSGLPLVGVVVVGGVAYLIYRSSNGGNGGSGRSRSRSGQYART